MMNKEKFNKGQEGWMLMEKLIQNILILIYLIMVRIEKALYEKVVNRMTRSKAIGAPRKWFYSNPYDHLRLNHHRFLKTTLFGRIIAPIARWFCQQEMKYNLSTFQQQGLTPEDCLLHMDKHLRRSVFFEHVARQTLHPYHWVLKVRRRQRFGRIDFAAPGFFVPDHIKNEASSQTYLDYLKLQKEWASHVFENYYSDITPEARRSVVPKINPLELIQNFGVLRNEAWERYFMNEHDQSWFDAEETKEVQDSRTFPFNLTTAQGKSQFQAYVNDFNEKVPGSFSPVGTKFDFKTYYAELGV